MNSVQPAVQSLLAASEQDQVQPQSGEAGEFSLDDSASGVASRHLKTSETTDDQKDEASAQDLSALMAMLLPQPTASTDPRNSGAGSDRLKTSALTGTDAKTLMKALGMMSQMMSQKQDTERGDGSHPLLSQTLQTLLNSASSQKPEGHAAQQATLAKFAVQDLHVLGSAKQTAANENGQTRLHPDLHASLHAAMKNQVADRADGVSSKVSEMPLTAVAAMSDLSSRSVSSAVTTGSVQTVAATSPDLDELGEKLNMLLKDRIQFQLDNQQQVSTIRLDPPSMGKLEIAVHLDGNQNLNVHIGASQSDVMKTLQQFSDQLRQHLVQHNFMQVNVQVSSDGQSQQQQQQQHQNEESAVLASASIEDTVELAQNESVLLKV